MQFESSLDDTVEKENVLYNFTPLFYEERRIPTYNVLMSYPRLS